MRKIILVLLLLAALGSPFAHADTLKIGECADCDSSTTPDNVLWEGGPDDNSGAGVAWSTGWFLGDEFRSIVKFPLDQGELVGATFTAATFGCYVESLGEDGNTTIEIHAISTANKGWIEGTKDGTTAGAGEPDWNHFSHTSPTTTWAGDPGLSAEGPDYVALVYGSFNGTSTGAKTAVLSGAAITYLNGKIGSDAEFLLFTTDEYISNEYTGITSAEGDTAANRPFLELTYEPATPTGAPQVIVVLF